MVQSSFQAGGAVAGGVQRGRSGGACVRCGDDESERVVARALWVVRGGDRCGGPVGRGGAAALGPPAAGGASRGRVGLLAAVVPRRSGPPSLRVLRARGGPFCGRSPSADRPTRSREGAGAAGGLLTNATSPQTSPPAREAGGRPPAPAPCPTHALVSDRRPRRHLGERHGLDANPIQCTQPHQQGVTQHEPCSRRQSPTPAIDPGRPSRPRCGGPPRRAPAARPRCPAARWRASRRRAASCRP
ncbi:MAG: hypothetical protein QOC54_1568 [Baekduia sp.]|nr:hypothetical protein [Baekduia sp.]